MFKLLAPLLFSICDFFTKSNDEDMCELSMSYCDILKYIIKTKSKASFILDWYMIVYSFLVLTWSISDSLTSIYKSNWLRIIRITRKYGL